MVIFRPAALGIGAVGALLGAVAGGALVKGDAEIPQALGDEGHAALHLAFFVGILDAQDHPASGGVGHPLGHHGGKHAADVQKAGGAGREAGDLGAVLQLPGRELGLHELLGRLGHVGEQQLGQFGIIGHVLITPARKICILLVFYQFIIAFFRSGCKQKCKKRAAGSCMA